MPSKLYVGNLAYSVSNSDLEQLFSQAGQVQSATVIMDKFAGDAPDVVEFESSGGSWHFYAASTAASSLEVSPRSARLSRGK